MQLKKPTRLRQSAALRKMLRETEISMKDIIYPVFVVEGTGIMEEIPSMKGQYHFSVDKLVANLPQWRLLGIEALILFGIPDDKDMLAECAHNDDGVVQQAIRAIKSTDSDFFIVTDICLCQFKSDGHCCFFDHDGHIERQKTLTVLNKIALSHARAGADMVAPSDMMDGRIQSIREALDRDGYERLPIMAYSAKYASSFYGPFREAAHSTPSFGDRKAYQMDIANKREAMTEMALDVAEGADILMVKPALPYLDIIQQAHDAFTLPIAAYQVSGEYAMLKNAVDGGLMDERCIYESLISIKRSGAKLILTYFAPEIQRLIEKFDG